MKQNTDKISILDLLAKAKGKKNQYWFAHKLSEEIISDFLLLKSCNLPISNTIFVERTQLTICSFILSRQHPVNSSFGLSKKF